ncbi:MAG: hypothetical protein WDN31_23080 [Hyphomicrobium sp.]
MLTLLFLPALYAAWFRVRNPAREAAALLEQAPREIGHPAMVTSPS